VVVDAIGKRHHHRARESPSKAPSHYTVEGSNIQLPQLLEVYHVTDPGEDVVVLVLVEH
jgi:hypothetical protein